MTYVRCAIVLCLAVILAGGACASEVTFGSGARSIAMGGAGLALIDSYTSASLSNPASLAASDKRLVFLLPSLELHGEGATVSDLRQRFDEIGNSSISEAVDLAETFGRRRTTLTASLAAGVAAGYGVNIEGEAQAVINPGEDFQDWVRAGTPTSAADLVDAGLIPDTSLASLQDYASNFTDGTYVGGKLVYTLPAVTLGTSFSTGKGLMYVGTKIKYIQSQVNNWDIVATADASGITLDADEQPRMKDKGLAADVGFIYKPDNSIIQFGLVVNNILQPNLSGIDTPTVLSIGAAASIKPGITVAADIVDLTNAFDDDLRLRMGVEWQILKNLVVRAGHTGNGFTYGLRAFGVDFAVSDKYPQMISKTLRY